MRCKCSDNTNQKPEYYQNLIPSNELANVLGRVLGNKTCSSFILIKNDFQIKSKPNSD